jgi:hypothetical protein
MDLANVLLTWASQILLAAAIASVILSAAILLNCLSQLLLKNLNEPPVVFHWVPFLGSTISYGIDPYKFFFSCQEKVIRPLRESLNSGDQLLTRSFIVRQYLYLHPTWPQDDSLPRCRWERIHLEWEAYGCECGGSLHSSYHTRVWFRCGV